MHSGNSYILKSKNQDLVVSYQSEAEFWDKILIYKNVSTSLYAVEVNWSNYLSQVPKLFHSSHSKDLPWKNAASICSA